jgi:hypothetical protein
MKRFSMFITDSIQINAKNSKLECVKLVCKDLLLPVSNVSSVSLTTSHFSVSTWQ